MQKLRVARPTDQLEAITAMYVEGLNLQVIGHFEDHDGFDGVMVGDFGAPYHLEFTSARGHEAGRAPTEDNLLIFYIPDPVDWEAACARMEASGFQPIPSFNPCWDLRGRTFEDLDGYRVALQNTPWDR